MSEEIPRSPVAPHENPPVNHEVTRASNNWLKKLGNKVTRLAGHVGLTIPAEFFTDVGAAFTTAGLTMTVGNMMVTAGNITNAIGPVGTAFGLVSSFIGARIGWEGAKHAGGAERTAYTTIKALMPLAALSVFISPSLPFVFMGISAASTLLAMRHRK